MAFDGRVVRLTASLGVAGFRAEDDLDALLARGDSALYRAKHEGRNRVVQEAG